MQTTRDDRAFRLAPLAGCRVERVGWLGDARTSEIECPDGWAAARLLLEYAKDDVLRDPEVQAVGRRLRERTTDRDELAGLVHYALRDRVRFAREVGEVFQSPTELVRMGVGDCDCHARAAFAFLGAAGVPVRMAFLASKRGGPRHVVTQALTSRGWTWLETTVPGAELGEEPRRAAIRAGVARPDILGDLTEVVTMGGLGVEGAQRYRMRVGVRTPLAELEQRPEDAVRLELVGEGFEAPTVYLEARELPADWPASLRGLEPGAAWTCWAEATYGRPECRVLPESIGELGLTLETESTNEAAVAPAAVHTRDLPDAFFVALKGLAQRVGIDAEKLLAVMHVESNGIRASAMHPSGAAVGLIQFSTMGAWSTLRGVGWGGTVDAFRALGPIGQLPFVERYFSGKPHLRGASPELVYADNWLPASALEATQRGRGRDGSYVVAAADGTRWGGQEGRFYRDNAGLDVTKDGKTTLDDLRVYLQRGTTGARWTEALARLRAAPAPSGLIPALALVPFLGLAALLAQELPRL